MRKASLESVAAELSRILTPGWIRINRYFLFVLPFHFVSASTLLELLLGPSQSIHCRCTGSIHGCCVRWQRPVRRVRPRYHGNGRDPPSRSDGATLALEDLQIGRHRVSLRYSAGHLLRGAEQRQRNQHEL